MRGTSSKEVLQTFNEWIADWIGTSSKPIGVVHDNATYFLGGAFKDAMLQRGWQTRLTSSLRHEGNLAESVMKQILYTSRTMLIAAGLPEAFWPYAFTTASYLRNRVISSRVDKTPYEFHRGKQPAVTFEFSDARSGSRTISRDHTRSTPANSSRQRAQEFSLDMKVAQRMGSTECLS